MDIGTRVINYFKRSNQYTLEYIEERCPGWLEGSHKYQRPGAGGSFLEETCFVGRIYGFAKALFD